MTAATTYPQVDSTTVDKRRRRRDRRRVQRPAPGYKVAFDPSAKADPARGRAREELERYSALQGWRAAAASPYTWQVCDEFPLNNIETPTGGRPRQYPDWLLFFMLIAVPFFGGSVRGATSLLADEAEWDRFTRHVHPYIPAGWTSPLTGLPKSDDPIQDAADQRDGTLMPPPKRHHTAHFLFCWRGKRVGRKKPLERYAKVREDLIGGFCNSALQQTFADGRLTTSPGSRSDTPTPHAP